MLCDPAYDENNIMRSQVEFTEFKCRRPWVAGLAAIVAVAMLASTARASDDADALAAKTLAIFDAKCSSCHSPKAKTKNLKKFKFDTILDLESLRANPKLIVPSDPVNSHIWKSIEEGEMPPQEDTDIPLLTPAEKEIVTNWINAGAPVGKTRAFAASQSTTGPTTGTSAVSGAGGGDSSAKPAHSFMDRLIKWLGNFHPLAAHTPIAVLMAAAIAEGLYFKYRAPALTGAARFCCCLGALGAIATAALGWAMAAHHTSSELLESHRWFGTIAAGAAIPIALVGEWGARRARRHGVEWHGFSRWAFRLSIFAIAAVIGFTAHLGGTLHWGEDFFKFPN